MRNLLLTIRFDGRAFSGWQIQQNAPTVMGALQQVLWAVLKEQVDLKGCSRTDAGVSAAEYCVSFQTEARIPCERLPLALNAKLPARIVALHCCEVSLDSHARSASQGKLYRSLLCDTPKSRPSLGWRARPRSA